MSASSTLLSTSPHLSREVKNEVSPVENVFLYTYVTKSPMTLKYMYEIKNIRLLMEVPTKKNSILPKQLFRLITVLIINPVDIY